MDFENIVSNVKIYDLEESLLASGYPMRTDLSPRAINDKDIQRGHTLSAACDTGNGAHGQFMTGIRVSFDSTCSNKMWVEAERYRFLEFVSSQSTMHRITKFDLDKAYNEYVDRRIIDIMKEKVLYVQLPEDAIYRKVIVTEDGRIGIVYSEECLEQSVNVPLERIIQKPESF